MKFLILAFAVACAQALPQEQAAQILKQELDINNEGSYRWQFETSNGIYGQAEGYLKNGPNSEYPSLESKGSSRYVSPQGEIIELTYVANEDGYQPQGSHLPTPHPVPEYIVRSIQYINSQQQPGRF
ncbi:hypothetical protein O0L34_g5895 [Tuta absoluta]|nr:hypothetical protein O0L34_g5895 [Tuta absoluta]